MQIEEPRDILQKLIKNHRNSTQVREEWIFLLKGAKYAFFIFLVSTISGVIWYFVSGEYLDPSRTVGSGVLQSNPASNTYGNIVFALVLTIISYVLWKKVLPWQQEKLRDEEK